MLSRESRADAPPGSRRSILEILEDLLSHTGKLLEQRLMLLRLEVEDTLGTLIRRLAGRMRRAPLPRPRVSSGFSPSWPRSPRC